MEQQEVLCVHHVQAYHVPPGGQRTHEDVLFPSNHQNTEEGSGGSQDSLFPPIKFDQTYYLLLLICSPKVTYDNILWYSFISKN